MDLSLLVLIKVTKVKECRVEELLLMIILGRKAMRYGILRIPKRVR